MPTTVAVKTWICSNCPYKWQFSGGALDSSPYDLTWEQIVEIFRMPQLAHIQAGKCPACFLRGESGRLGLAIDPDSMTKVHVASDEELESRQMEDLDQDGNLIVEQVSEKESLGIVDGKISVVIEPVYEPQLRPLTDQELASLKEQRDRNLDKLEKVAA